MATMLSLLLVALKLIDRPHVSLLDTVSARNILGNIKIICKDLIYLCNPHGINPFCASCLFLYPLKSSENLWFFIFLEGIEWGQSHEMD